MSNNSEYTKEYIDTVEEWFRNYDRVIHGPAMDKVLSYQKVLEFGAIHGEVEKFKEYLIENATSAEYYADQVEILEDTESRLEREKEELQQGYEEALDDIQDELDSVTNELTSFIEFINDIQDPENSERLQKEYSKLLDALGEVTDEYKPKKKSKK